jgi:hypothetical protein
MIKTVIILAAWCSVNSEVIAESWPVIQSPPQSDVVWVGDDMNQNGLPMQVKSFESKNGVDSVISFYKEKWNNEDNSKCVENKIGEWNVIGRQKGDYYLTVQAKNNDSIGSKGFLSVSKLPVYSSPEEVDFPRLNGSTIVSHTGSNDIGVSGETFIIKNQYSIQSNISFYESELAGKGWVETKNDMQYVSGGLSKFLYFQRRKQALTVVISSDDIGSSVIVANRVRY